MTPFASALVVLNWPWQHASYILVCLCSVVWLAKQLRGVLHTIMVYAMYSMVAAACYLCMAFMRKSAVFNSGFDHFYTSIENIINGLLLIVNSEFIKVGPL